MRYKYPHEAFLFEAIVGFVTLILVLAFGKVGYVGFVFLILRPIALEATDTPTDQMTYRLYYDAMRIAVYFAAASILLTIAAFQFAVFRSHDKTLALTLILPWYVLAHGFIGYVLSRPKR